MTVAEIQKYISEMHDLISSGKPFPKAFMKTTLSKINTMLDELEPNTISQAIKVIDKEKDKLKFDTDKHQVDSCIFEIRNILGLGAKENNKC